MVDGLARELKVDHIEAFSVGIETLVLNPNMFKVMEEVGVDITDQKSENIRSLAYTQLDVVFSVSRLARET